MPRPIVLGIAGDSAAGKTTFARGIARLLREDRVTLLGVDDYHRYNRVERARLGLTALNPEANYIDIIEQHLKKLKYGDSILKPIYNHVTGELDPPVYVEAREFIIVEGLLGFHTRAMRDCYTVKVYLRPAEELRFQWKMQRDSHKSDHSATAVQAELQHNEPDSAAYIQPQAQWADVIVAFYPLSGQVETNQLDAVSSALIVRPILPFRPDLSALPLVPAGEELRLALDRDMGMPVDRLDISGALSAIQAGSVADALWADIPREHWHLRRESLEPPATAANTHAPALSQLLVASCLLRAASSPRK